MESPGWLESSLLRSGRLGLEVLERASRRTVDWTSVSQTPASDSHVTVKRTSSELDDAFATISNFMAQTTHHCKKYYESSCTEPSNTEKTHMSRFHTQPGAGRTSSALPARRHVGRPGVHVGSAGEDFYVEVSPGTYAVTASLPESQLQTQLVSVKAGESINLTFNL